MVVVPQGCGCEHLLPRGSPDVIGNSEFCSVSAKFPNINFSFFSPDHRQRNTRLPEGQGVYNSTTSRPTALPPAPLPWRVESATAGACVRGGS